MSPKQAALSGQHVVLEPLQAEHAPPLLLAADDPALWRQVFRSEPGLEELEQWVALRLDARQDGEELPFAQRDARTGRLFGCTALTDLDMANRRMAIGHTWIDRAHRRDRANTEAKYLLLEHAFEELGAGRVAFVVGGDNQQAHQTLERIGASPEGCLRNYRVRPDDTAIDCLVYSVIDREWPEVQSRLNRYLLTG